MRTYRKDVNINNLSNLQNNTLQIMLLKVMSNNCFHITLEKLSFVFILILAFDIQ